MSENGTRMNAKRKGTRREHQTRALLEAAGYVCVRAAGSHGAFDLVGFSTTGVVLVQVKANGWPGRAEMETLRAFPAPLNARKEVHRWRDGQRAPDVRIV
jgi:hypothetical protein